MVIRRATIADIPTLMDLLQQVLYVHHVARPDLFQEKGVKYTEDELAALIADDNRPISFMKMTTKKCLRICLLLLKTLAHQEFPKKHSLLMICVWTKQRADKKLVKNSISCFEIRQGNWLLQPNVKRLECK